MAATSGISSLVIKRIIICENPVPFPYAHVLPGKAADIPAYDPQVVLDESRTKAAITYIMEHYEEPITLQDIADSIHISKSECCRCFKRCLQLTPFDYLLKYRIYSAVDLLAQDSSTLSISDIALKVGFNSSSYFNKLFKKYIGYTPSAYKKILAQNTEHIAIEAKDSLYYSGLLSQ